MAQDFLALFQNEVFNNAVHIFLTAWPIWVPIIVLNVSFSLWLSYIRREWILKQGSVLLEIKIPRDVLKTPAAMEFVFDGIWESSGAGTLADAFWEGKLRDWFSLEIVALNGEVRFFIWAFPKWKKTIEARIYAQYPGAEVVEVKDYALDFHYDADKFTYGAITMKLVKADAYPIKTYLDYELEKTKLKEQAEAIDPLTPVIEYLGSVKPSEFVAYQILIQAHRKENYLDGRILTKPDWKAGIKTAIKDIVEKEGVVKPEKDKPASLMALTDDKKEAIRSIERNAGKLPFDTMIRTLYIAPKEEAVSRVGGLIGSIRQFGTHNLNGIRPDAFVGAYQPWQDFNGIRKKEAQSSHLEAYRRRSFFNAPYRHLNGKPFILTTEELATIFHIPGAMATTPNLKRAPSKKAEAPANLPV